MRTRTEMDSIGTLEIPAEAYYGVQSYRAKKNFPITEQMLNPEFIKSMAKIKKAAAMINEKTQALDSRRAWGIMQACNEVSEGKYQKEFIVGAIQGGAGTSANMNANEVIANRAIELLGGRKGEYSIVHPNDHVNMAQSTNDVIPTAGKITALKLLDSLDIQLERLEKELFQKSVDFDSIVKMGRTQLQDAVPMRVGQSFHAYYSVMRRDRDRILESKKELYAVNLGATAIGSAINTETYYLDNIVKQLAKISGYPLYQADDLFDATQNIDCFVMVSNALKTCAVSLSKICNDLRLLSSGPRTGLAELVLPAKQNGSSIMPGKVNPVIPEVVSQVAYQVIGNDVTITMAAESGQLELNAFEPVVFYNLFESIQEMTYAVQTLVDNCIAGITVNEEQCKKHLEESVGISTALCPYIGYQKAASLAKKSLKTNKSVRSLVLEEELLTQEQVEEILNPYKMTEANRMPREEHISA